MEKYTLYMKKEWIHVAQVVDKAPSIGRLSHRHLESLLIFFLSFPSVCPYTSHSRVKLVCFFLNSIYIVTLREAKGGSLFPTQVR